MPRKRLAFRPDGEADAAPAHEGTNRPAKKRTKKKKLRKKKKKQPKSKPTSENNGPFSNRAFALDSVFLLILNNLEGRKLCSDDKKYLGEFKTEIYRFQHMSEPECDALAADIRQALNMLVDIPALMLDRDTIAKARNGDMLADIWVSAIRAGVVAIQADITRKAKAEARRSARAAPKVPEKPRVEEFLQTLSITDDAHPRGGHRDVSSSRRKAASKGRTATKVRTASRSSTADVIELLDSTESDTSSDDSTLEDGEIPKLEEIEPEEGEPLVVDDEVKRNLKLIRSYKRPADIRDGTATFVADKFAYGSPYILDMLQGNTPWPSFSKGKLFDACGKISEAYKIAQIRIDCGEGITDELRRRLLDSEFKTVRDTRMLLSLARLGPGGYDDYLSKVTTEASRRDFESTFHDKCAFKLFMQSLASVKQTKQRPYYGKRANMNNRSGGRRSYGKKYNRRNRRPTNGYRPLKYSRAGNASGNRSRSAPSSSKSRSAAGKNDGKRRRV